MLIGRWFGDWPSVSSQLLGPMTGDYGNECYPSSQDVWGEGMSFRK